MAGSTVTRSELHAGSRGVTTLHDRAAAVGRDVVGTLAGMAAGSAAHLEVASALSKAASQGATTYAAAAEVYQHIGQSLPGSADTHETPEQDVTPQDPVPAFVMAGPDGGAGALYEYATRLEMAAASASGLGANTLTTISSIHQAARPVDTAILTLAGDLGGGMAATAAPLVTIAAAVRSYARTLEVIHVKVSACRRSAARADVPGDSAPQASAMTQTAARDVQAAVNAWQQVGREAAARIAGAAAQLGGAFAAGKPVRTYLASLPGSIGPHAAPAGTQITGASAQNLASGTLGELPVVTDQLSPLAMSSDGLPLRSPMPLSIARHIEGPVSCERPLALDYRTWLDRDGNLVRPGMASRT
jgi:hypothetical protein